MKMARIWVLGAALALVASPSFAQRGGGFGFGGPGGGSPAMLLAIPEVQQELKLDQAQLDLLKGVQTEMREKMQAMFQNSGFDFQNATPEQRQQFQRQMAEKMQSVNTDMMKKVGEVLDAKQMARLKQLGIQRAGTRALAQKEVQDELKLSADQKSKIQQTLTTEGEARRALFQNGGFDFQNATPEQRQEFGRKMQEISAATDPKLLAVLTDAQKKQFEGMKGAAFKFPEGGFGRRNRQ
jgi:hypothetical protein